MNDQESSFIHFTSLLWKNARVFIRGRCILREQVEVPWDRTSSGTFRKRRCDQRSCGDKLRHRVSVTPRSHLVVDSRRRSSGTSMSRTFHRQNLVHLRGCSGWAFGRRVLMWLGGASRGAREPLPRSPFLTRQVPSRKHYAAVDKTGHSSRHLLSFQCTALTLATHASNHAIISLLVRTSRWNCSPGFWITRITPGATRGFQGSFNPAPGSS